MYEKKTFHRPYNRDRGFVQKKKDFGPRRNEYIRTTPIVLIDEKGENLGEIETAKALIMAKEAGLDLVEVGAMAKPPVCKIMDFAKYQYEQSKKQKKGKAKAKEMKEFRFSPVIETHDVNIRVKRAKEYLSKGHPVRLSMQRKGRQTFELAMSTFAEILTNFDGYSSIETDKKVEGRKIFLTLKPDGKTKDKQNSSKKSEADKPKGESKAKSDVPKDSTTPPKDKTVKKSEKKKV